MNRDAFIASSLPHQDVLLSFFGRDARLVILDIGSCEGEDSVRYARLFPSARIWAFEPLPSNVERIRANLARYEVDRVEVVPVALSDSAGEATFYVSSGRPDNVPDSDWDYGNKSSSLLKPDAHLATHPWIQFDDSIEVETDRLDAVARRLGLARADYIHMDVQGAELKVLAGAGDLLNRVRAIWMEVEAEPLYKDQPLKPEVERFMGSHGFVKWLDRVSDVSGDQLYINPRFFRRRVIGRRLKQLVRRLGFRAR